MDVLRSITIVHIDRALVQMRNATGRGRLQHYLGNLLLGTCLGFVRRHRALFSFRLRPDVTGGGMWNVPWQMSGASLKNRITGLQMAVKERGELAFRERADLLRL